jgi:Domain of unknown function (DUF4412)
MNRSLLLLTGIFLSFQASAQFEGVIESVNLTSDESGATLQFVMRIWVKNDMVKLEMSSIGKTPASSLLYRRDAGKVLMFNDEEKTFFEIPQGDPARDEARGTMKDDGLKVRHTGKKKKIMGYPCEQFLLRSGEAETEYWGTKGLSALASSLSRATGTDNQVGAGLNDDLMKMGYFPLVAVTKLGGRVLESSEVTRLEARAVPQETFEIPTGYKRQSSRDLLRSPGLER